VAFGGRVVAFELRFDLAGLEHRIPGFPNRLSYTLVFTIIFSRNQRMAEGVFFVRLKNLQIMTIFHSGLAYSKCASYYSQFQLLPDGTKCRFFCVM
jgi:hypothetical protein